MSSSLYFFLALLCAFPVLAQDDECCLLSNEDVCLLSSYTEFPVPVAPDLDDDISPPPSPEKSSDQSE
jgi:hypothetical protein